MLFTLCTNQVCVNMFNQYLAFTIGRELSSGSDSDKKKLRSTLPSPTPTPEKIELCIPCTEVYEGNVNYTDRNDMYEPKWGIFECRA